MSTKCLVTKLQETVNNDSLVRLGELKIYFDEVESPTAIGQGFIFKATPDTSLYVENGHLTSSSLSDDLGTEAVINTIPTVWCVSNSVGATIVNVKDKYKLSFIQLRGGTLNNSNHGQVKHIHLNIEELEYCPLTLLLASYTSCIGDIEKAFKRNNVIQYVELDKTNVFGDISVFNGKTSLIQLKVNGSAVTGDIASIITLPALQELNVTNCSGDLTNVASSSLKTFISHDSSYVGNISFFNNLTALTSVEIYNSPLITGSIESIILPSTCGQFLFRSNNNITGSIATFRANNPNCTTVDFAGCRNVTA